MAAFSLSSWFAGVIFGASAVMAIGVYLYLKDGGKF